MTRCERCTRPMADTAYVCSPCAGHYRADLSSVPSLAVELEPARYRQTRYGTGGLGGWQEPWDDRVREVEHAVTNTLTTVARDVAETRGLVLPMPERGEHQLATVARWLSGQVEWIRHQPEALRTFDEIRAAVRALRRVVDRPADSWWAGPCNELVTDEAGGSEGIRTPHLSAEAEHAPYTNRPLTECGADLYAPTGAETIRCRSCGATYDAAARRDWLLDEAQDVLGHAEMVAGALVRYGLDITSATVRGYARHNRVVSHGHDGLGRPLYRVGDVIEVYRDIAAREAARIAKRLARQTGREGDSAA